MAVAPLPNTTVEVLDKTGQFSLPWRRWFQQLASLTGTTGARGPAGPAGPAGASGTTTGLEFVGLSDGDWSLLAGNGIQLAPSPAYGGPVTITAIPSSRTTWQYRAKTTATSGYPGDGYILWNNATQTSATTILVSHLTFDDLDIDIILSFVTSGQKLVIQDANASANFQEWTISGSPTNTNPGTATSYWNFPVTLVSSGGTGTTGFPNNHQIILILEGGGSSGTVTSISQSTGITLTPNPITTTGSVAIANTAVTPGTYGDGTHVGQFTVDQQGRLTFAQNVAITGVATNTNWFPLTSGTEPPNWITNGAGVPIAVAYTP